MNFNLIKIDNILIEHNNNNYSVKYKNAKNETKPLLVKLPLLYLPFGIDKEYGSFYLKAQLRKTNDFKHNKELKLFLEFIEQLEELFQKQIKKEISSQIRYSKDYDTIVVFKILKTKTGITTEITQNNEYFNFFKITKNMSFKGNIIIDSLWIYNNTIFYKIKLKNLDISV